jgi:imidazolonepropionase-like amidohydrolase
MRAQLHLVVVAFGMVALAQKQPAAVIEPSSVGSTVYITHVTVIDTETGKEARNRAVKIEGDRISEVKSSEIEIPARFKIVDGTGKYLIPGLWDMHVHGNNKSWFASFFPLYLANGVTGIREMFGPPDANAFRANLVARNIDAPGIYLGSPIVDGNPPVWQNSISVKSPEEARRVVEEQKQRGADFIKVYNRLTRDEYFAIVDEARRQNIPVEGHVPRLISAWEAAAAKQKSIEHLTGIPLACSSREQELFLPFAHAKSSDEARSILIEASRSYDKAKCQRLFAEFKKSASWPVPTLTVSRSFAMLNDPEFRNDDRIRYFSGEARTWLIADDDFRLIAKTGDYFAGQRELFAFEKKLVRALFEARVPMLAGTDVGNPYCFPGFSLHDELALMVEAGVSPLAALQSATRNPAQFMDAADRYGAVSPGKIADLVLLDADPLVDIHNTTKIFEVFLAGKEFDRVALNGMLERAVKSARAARATADGPR